MAFKRLDAEDILISTDAITATVWSNNQPTLINFYTSSIQVGDESGAYVYNIYSTQSLTSNYESIPVEFNITYCHVSGSGSALYNQYIPNLSPSRTMYGQYRNLVLGDENAKFSFGQVTSNHFYVISIDRSGYKQSLLPGTFNLKLKNGLNEISLTDDSSITTIVKYTDAGRVFNIMSGSNGILQTGSDLYNQTTGGTYGMFLPDIATIILNADALDALPISGGISLNTNQATVTSSINANLNMSKLYNSLNSFTLNSDEALTSNYIFVRARNSEFNYSENPSYISGENGSLIYPEFINNPQTYITTVGLYNDSNELLAVAKLSKPLLKDFTKELLLRVKLDF